MVNQKQFLRIEKANRILASVKKATEQYKEYDEKVLIAQVCLEFGAGRRYIKEILDDLVLTGKLTRTERGLIYPDG